MFVVVFHVVFRFVMFNPLQRLWHSTLDASIMSFRVRDDHRKDGQCDSQTELDDRFFLHVVSAGVLNLKLL